MPEGLNVAPKIQHRDLLRLRDSINRFFTQNLGTSEKGGHADTQQAMQRETLTGKQ